MSKQAEFETFLARVRKTYLKKDDFKDLKTSEDFVKVYNGNKSFDSKDTRFLGAIEFDRDEGYLLENFAFPLDKNNFTFPIAGETVLIIKTSDEYFYIPYTVTQYPNYREDYKTTLVGSKKEIKKVEDNSKQKDYKEVNSTGTTSNSPSKKPEDKSKKYKVNDKIKFLEPTEGDTILSGRVSNTIRFSEFFLTEDGKTSSPSIFIRNFQDPSLDSKPIGTLIKEDINKDGSSIYITSNKVKIPFKETVKKEKVAFKPYPSSADLTGHQIYINSDRVLISAKKNEFIVFSTKNAGILTDAKFTVDAKDEIYMHNEKNITIHSKGSNNIFLNSDSGKIYLGKDKGEGDAGAAVQKMVLGGELVKILEELIDAINQQVYLTPSGPTATGPTNAPKFNSIKSKLKVILSAKNFLSKN
jgi:hypothetical protein